MRRIRWLICEGLCGLGEREEKIWESEREEVAGNSRARTV